jgi:ParB family chromosome partitioning protein
MLKNMQQISNQKLGRGISALLGNNISSEVVSNSNNIKEVVKSIKMDRIVAGIYQPRTFFDEEKLINLSKSFAKNGIIQPIIVRKADRSSDVFEIIAGERRYRASKMAGLTEIPAIVKDVSNSKALEFAIIENIQRSDLSAIEEGRGYKQLIDEFGYTQEKVANKLGKSRSYVANIVRLLSLPKEVQKMVAEGLISSSHARSLIGKENAITLAQEIVDQSLSVRDIEEISEDYEPKGKPDESSDIFVLEGDEQKILRKEYLKTLESSLSQMLGELKVKANYDAKKKKGKLTIFYNDFEEIENLINQLER